MDEARSRTPPGGVRPWFLWLIDRAPVSSLWVGVAVTAALLGVLFVIPGPYLPPEAPFSPEVGRRIMISFCVATGLNIALMSWLERATLRDLAALRPFLRGMDEKVHALERSLTHFPARALWLAAAVGIGGHLFFGNAARGFTGPLILPAWHSLLGIANWLVVAPATYVLFSYASRFRGLAPELRDLHLFDLRPLAPFARLGLRTALFYSVGFTIVFGSHRDWSADGIGVPAYVLWATLAWVLMCVALAALPTWGVRRRIQAEKHAELDRVRAAMDGAPDALEGSAMAAHAAELRGVALLEYRDKVEAVREWPFDASGLRRLALYVVIPPLGWLGGALVERAIDRVLQ
jgi:hypothetical protein